MRNEVVKSVIRDILSKFPGSDVLVVEENEWSCIIEVDADPEEVRSFEQSLVLPLGSPLIRIFSSRESIDSM